MKRFLILALSLPCMQAQAQMNAWVQPGDSESARLVISGEWGNRCVPVLEEAKLEADAITLVASRESGLKCTAEKSAYSFEVAVDSLAESAPDDGIYAVSLYVREENERAAVLSGFDLAVLGDPDPVVPESGLWWPEPGGSYATSGPGVGFSIEVQGDQSVVMLNGYAANGAALWLLSTGSLEHGVIRGNLTELAEGQSFFGPFTEPQAALSHGRALIRFHDRGRATLWLVDDRNGRFRIQPISLVRFAFGPAPEMSGSWLVVPEAGGSSLALDLELVEQTHTAGRWELTDPGTGARLDCQRPAQRTASPPQGCMLSGPRTVHFTDIGLNRWRGFDLDGNAWLAIRID